LLFVKQCNALNEILPNLFEKTNDYTELLLNLSVIDVDGIVSHLVNDIPEEDFDVSKEGQVEIIGWLYQYYNTEPKDETFALLKKNVKITKERIPSATQLFTPDWIVRYMVENSLGRLWVEGHPNEELKSNWKYYLEEAQQEAEVQAQLEAIREEYKNLNPEDIKVIDPCMGSGHILVYCFDVLMQIYEAQGYSQRDAAQSILIHNIYGLDIDDRAAQLAYFAVMMKAREYDRRIFSRGIKPHIYAIEESNSINRSQLKYFGAGMNDVDKTTALSEIEELLNTLTDAKEYGSILNVNNYDWDLLHRFAKNTDSDGQMSLDSIGLDDTQELLIQLIDIAQVMAQKYDVVVTNPPYMGGSGMDEKLSKFVKKNYPNSKSDLFAVFIEKCSQMVKENGYQGMITQHSWMFLSSFENLRKELLTVDTINMAHLGGRAFEEIGGEVVQTTSFVLRNSHVVNYKGTYCRLIEPNTQQGKEDMFLAGENRYTSQQDNFSKIPGSPVAYWVGENFINNMNRGNPVREVAHARSGAKTGKNEVFIHSWWEVSFDKIELNCSSYDECIDSGMTWFPYNKGGDAKNWYGNRELVVDFYGGGEHIREYSQKYGTSIDLNAKDVYFKQGITWTALTSSRNTFRFSPKGAAFDSNKGPMVFPCNDNQTYYLLGLFISHVAQYHFKVFNPSISLQNGDVDNFPIIDDGKQSTPVILSKINVELSKSDWDAYETSWDFKKHPLV
jgi:hypothetical protein